MIRKQKVLRFAPHNFPPTVLMDQTDFELKTAFA